MVENCGRQHCQLTLA